MSEEALTGSPDELYEDFLKGTGDGSIMRRIFIIALADICDIEESERDSDETGREED